jgi:uncharacterized coiled-coil protein SlyX
MAILTKAQLQAANSSSFPNNNSQLITPQVLRDYNTNVIDTLVDSLDTGSFARTDITNDFTQTNNFTSISASAFVSASNFIGDGSKLTNITASTALPILDEGVLQGFATSMNFTGSAISAQVIAGTAVVQVNIEGAGLVTTASFNAFTSSTNQFTQSASSSISQLNASSASQQISINALNVYTASQSTASIVNSITELNSFTASQEIYNTAISNKVTSLEIATASLFTSVANLNQSSASQQISINNLNTTTASLLIETQNLELFSASALTSLSNLNTATASLFTSTSLSLTTASFNTGTRNLTFTKGDTTTFSVNIPDVTGSTGNFVTTASFNSYTSSNDQRVSSLEVNSASVNTSITNINTTTASLNTSVSALNTFTASQSTASIVNSINELNTFSASALVSISNLNTTTQSLNTSVTNINQFTQSAEVSINSLNSATSSYVTESETASFARTNVDNNFTANQTFTNITAVSASFTYVQTTYETSSIIYSSGSNQFGDELSDIQTLSGSVKVQGSLTVNGTPVLTSSVDISGLVTTASFNAYTQSNDDKVNSLINATASYATSAITASSLITASAVGNTITFTKGDASTFNVSVASTPIDTGSFATTASFNAYTQSNDQRVSSLETNSASVNISITALNTFTASQSTASLVTSIDNLNQFSASALTSISNLNSATASLQSATASLFTSASLGLTTASFAGNTLTFTKGNGTTFGVVIPDVSGSAGTTVIEVVYTGENITKGDPLYISGSQGANPIVYKADASNPAKMPVTFISNETIGAANTTNAIVLGLIEGIDLTGYAAGQTIYVAEGGGYSLNLPSGSNSITQLLGVITKGGSGGKGLVLNPGPAQLPGLDTGYMWVGGTTNQPVEITTASFASSASFNSYTASNDQKVNSLIAATGSYTTTSSFNAYTSSTDGRLNNIETTTASLLIETANLETFSASALISISNLNTATASLFTSTSLNLKTASVNLNTITFTKGDNSTFALTVDTGSGGGGGGAAFPYTGSAQITGSLGVTGSVSGLVNSLSISSNTASLDFNNGNFFTLQLVSGSITHLTAANIKAGQTINLLVKMASGSAAASGSLTFSPTFKFAGGFDYTPTQITASQDLVSFVTFDTTQIFAAQVKNLS